MDRRAGRPMTQRQLQVSEQIRQVIAKIFENQEVQDSEIFGRIITVTEVRISPDFRNATAFVLPLGGGSATEINRILLGLNRASSFLRKRIAQSLQLRRVPKLSFLADGSFDCANSIEELLKTPSVARDLLTKKTDLEEER